MRVEAKRPSIEMLKLRSSLKSGRRACRGYGYGLFACVLLCGCSAARTTTLNTNSLVSEQTSAASMMEVPPGMVAVPAGAFQMGSSPGSSNEEPVHEVYVSGFFIDKYEVTVEEYTRCVDAGGCNTPKMTHDDDRRSYNYGASGRDKHPINGVDWHQAKAYCAWSGKRLPTEAEWEKAARGTDGRKYPWGNEGPSCALAVTDDGGAGCGEGRTWEVGSKSGGVSPFGAYDMAGNVWEWTADWYDKSYYSISPMRDPKGPEQSWARVFRGGGWYYTSAFLRAAIRGAGRPGSARNDLGFRCVRSLP